MILQTYRNQYRKIIGYWHVYQNREYSDIVGGKRFTISRQSGITGKFTFILNIDWM